MLTRDRHLKDEVRGFTEVPRSSEVLGPSRSSAPAQVLPTRQAWVRLAVVALIGAGFAVTSSLAFAARDADKADDVTSLQRQAAAVTAAVETRIGHYVETLYGLKGLVGSNPSVSRAEFADFLAAANVTERLPGFQALEWAPIVLHEDLTAYEEAVQADTSINSEGYPGFAIHPASENADHIVVDYIVPFEGNERAFGFDLGTNPARRAAIELAASTGLPVATAPITLVQESGDQQGFLIFVPVFREDQLVGMVLAVFRVGDLLAGTVDTGLDMHIMDVTDGVGEPLLGVDHDDTSTVASQIITVGNRVWEITVAIQTTSDSTSATAIAILVAGLVSTLAIVALVIVVSRARDRAERRAMQATRELSLANANLTRSNEDLAEFASVASHDLQTPVRNVLHATEILREDLQGSPDDSVSEYLGIIERSVMRMQQLVSSILEYANLNRGDHVAPTSIDLNDIVNEVLRTRRDQIDELGGTVSVGHLPNALIDSIQAFRVVDNLIGNAIKYSSADRNLHINISGSTDGSTSTLNVADNGIGFDPTHRDKIFTMFQRLHSDSEYEGSGMGLAIVKRVAEQYGGTCCATSEHGVGSVFTIRVPTP